MPSKGDIKFGQLAVEMEFTSKEKIEEALKLQAQLEKQGKVTSLDRIMLKKGILDGEQIQEIEKKQGRRIVFCPECSNKLNVAIFGPGTRIRCPKCDTSLTVPSGVKYEVVDRKEPPAKKPAKADRQPADTIKVKKGSTPASKKKKDEDEVDLLDDDGPKEDLDKESLDDAVDLLDDGTDLDDLADDVEVLDEGAGDLDAKDDDIEMIEEDELGPKPPKAKEDKKKSSGGEKPGPGGKAGPGKFKRK